MDAVATVRLRDGALFCIATAVALRVIVSVATALVIRGAPVPPDATSGFETSATPGLHNVVDSLNRWDAAWFIRIASVGYATHDVDAAFFPGYPLLIRAVTATTPIRPVGAATLLSDLAFVGSLIVLYALTTRELSVAVARRTVVLLACFPGSFLLIAPYSESPYLLASLLAFWWVRRDRWPSGAVAAAAACAIRAVGVLLVPSLAYEAWRSEPTRRRRRLLAACAPVVVLVGEAIFWRLRSGDALWPIHAQEAWGRELAFAPVTVIRAVVLGVRGLGEADGLYRTADLVLVAILVIPLIARWRSIPTPYLLYSSASIALFLSFPSPERPLLSAARFLLVVFPAFWALALALTGRRFVFAAAAFGAACLALVIAFADWHFVF